MFSRPVHHHNSGHPQQPGFQPIASAVCHGPATILQRRRRPYRTAHTPIDRCISRVQAMAGNADLDVGDRLNARCYDVFADARAAKRPVGFAADVCSTDVAQPGLDTPPCPQMPWNNQTTLTARLSGYGTVCWPMAAAQDVGCWMLDVGRWLRRDVGSVARTQVEIGLLLLFVCIAVDAASCIPLDCLR